MIDWQQRAAYGMPGAVVSVLDGDTHYSATRTTETLAECAASYAAYTTDHSIRERPILFFSNGALTNQVAMVALPAGDLVEEGGG